jgi:hypothetical protein
VFCRNRDVLTQIRIRTTELRIRILLFPGLSRCQQKVSFFSRVCFAYYRQLPNIGTLTSAFKDNKFLKGHKTAEIKVFSYFICFLMEGSGSIQIITDPGGQKLTDPDLCQKQYSLLDPPDGRGAGGGISCGGCNSLVSITRPLRHTSGPAQRAWNKRISATCSSSVPVPSGKVKIAPKKQCCGSGSGAFLTPGSGIRNRFFLDPGSRIPDPKPIFLRAF